MANCSQGILVGFVSRDEAIKSCDRGPKGQEQTKWLQHQDSIVLIPKVLFLDCKSPHIILPETFSHEVDGAAGSRLMRPEALFVPRCLFIELGSAQQ
jgi:hypothetical protein